MSLGDVMFLAEARQTVPSQEKKKYTKTTQQLKYVPVPLKMNPTFHCEPLVQVESVVCTGDSFSWF